jgi:hypothetical protein
VLCHLEMPEHDLGDREAAVAWVKRGHQLRSHLGVAAVDRLPRDRLPGPARHEVRVGGVV